MKRNEAARLLMTHGKLGQGPNEAGWELLVKDGFAARTNSGIMATVATPLALLAKTQFFCAQQLAESGEIEFDSVPPAQKKHMATLIENGWAIKYGSAWEPTPGLIEAIDCWRKAKEGLK